MSSTICLNMIVKDESRVIRRCLESIRPFVQRWVIVDTGSTDGTQALVREALRDVPGELHERPWRNFGHNRSEALSLALGTADYVFVIDADERLVAKPGFHWGRLTAEEYLVPCRYDGDSNAWHRSTLLKASLPWRYEGVVHEFPTCDRAHSIEKFQGVEIVSHTDGARATAAVSKYLSDAQLLEEALAEDPSNGRNTYYLGQSYRSAGEPAKALSAFERRATMGGWAEETWNAMFQVALLKHELAHEWPGVLAAYLRAYQFRPERAEPLCTLATYHRSKSEWALAELFARAAAAIPRPSDIFIVEESVYDWRAIDELSIATYYTGKYGESETLCRKLLSNPKLPANQRARVEENLSFSVGKRSPGENKSKNDAKRQRRKR